MLGHYFLVGDGYLRTIQAKGSKIVLIPTTTGRITRTPPLSKVTLSYLNGCTGKRYRCPPSPYLLAFVVLVVVVLEGAPTEWLPSQ